MKKKLFSILVLLTFGIVTGQNKINWMPMNDALAAQASNPKMIFIDMYTNWCGPCKLLDRNTFSNPDVIQYINENYYAVKFNAEGEEPVTYMNQTFGNPNYDPAKATRRNSQHEFAMHLSIRAYPTVAFLNEKGQLLTTVKSYRSPQQLELYLKLFASGAYLNLKTQEAFNEYSSNFKPKFKG
jgi:thioredoxin-related protein